LEATADTDATVSAGAAVVAAAVVAAGPLSGVCKLTLDDGRIKEAKQRIDAMVNGAESLRAMLAGADSACGADGSVMI